VIVDLAFPLRGGPIPADHGFALYSAVTEASPPLHGITTFGIHPIGGRAAPQRRLGLTARSRLVIRTDHAEVPRFLALAGRSLRVGDAQVLVGVPVTLPLRPRPALQSRLVIITGFLDPETFLAAATRQLDVLGIAGTPALISPALGTRFEDRTRPREGPIRRTLSIHGREVVGFAVRVTALPPDDSLRLQALGLGGRRRFGCGVFVPTRER
jgi:CRISPR-associated protein Cas6